MPARNRFDQVIDDWDPILRRAFLESVQNVRNRAQLDRLVEMIRAGDVAGALRAVGLDPASFRPLSAAIERAFEAGGRYAIKSVPPSRAEDGLRVVVQFDVRNQTAETWLREHSSTKVVEIVADQQRMLKDVLEDGLRRGVNPRDVGLNIVGRINPVTGRREGGFIGLTQSQSEWVRNYEAELRSDRPLAALERMLRDRRFDAAVRRAASTGQPLTNEQVTKMVTTYRNRALRYRAETIGRTEAMASLHAAQDQAMIQAIDGKQVDPAAVSFVWRTAQDLRVRDSHRSMEGQVSSFEGTFTTGSGAKLRYPGDPKGPPGEIINCRCWREPKIDFLRGIK